MAKRKTYQTKFNELASKARQETIDLMLAECEHKIDLAGHDIYILCPLRDSDGLYSLQKITKVWIEPNSIGNEYRLSWETDANEEVVDDRWYINDKLYFEILEGVYRYFGKFQQTFSSR